MKIKSIKKVQRAESLFEKLNTGLRIFGTKGIESEECVGDVNIIITPENGILTGSAIGIIQDCLKEYPEACFYVDNNGKDKGVRCVVFIGVYVETPMFDSKSKNLITRGGCAVRIVAEMAGGYLAAVKTNKDGSEECFAVHADEGCVSYDMESDNDIYTYKD